jgi:ABC-type polysaccharide/polyol phosphate transport system ATPase subunit
MILGISGRKQAGKNTTANILHGIVLKEQGFIKDW